MVGIQLCVQLKQNNRCWGEGELVLEFMILVSLWQVSKIFNYFFYDDLLLLSSGIDGHSQAILLRIYSLISDISSIHRFESYF